MARVPASYAGSAAGTQPARSSHEAVRTRGRRRRAGNYTVKIEDDSDQHDFHLSGPTVSKLTSIIGEGKSTWHVTLKKGKSTYMCDPHSAFMKGSFTVS